MFEVICPEGHKLSVEERYAGKRIRCPKCSGVVTVPSLDRPDIPIPSIKHPPKPNDPIVANPKVAPPSTGSKPPPMPKPVAQVPDFPKETVPKPVAPKPVALKSNEQKHDELKTELLDTVDDSLSGNRPVPRPKPIADDADEIFITDDSDEFDIPNDGFGDDFDSLTELPAKRRKPKLNEVKKEAKDESSRPGKRSQSESTKVISDSLPNRQLLIIGGVCGLCLAMIGVGMALTMFLRPGSGSTAQVQKDSSGSSDRGSASSPTGSLSLVAETDSSAAAQKNTPSVVNPTDEVRFSPGVKGSRPRTVISFAAPVKHLVVAGHGSHLLAALPDLEEVAVIDVAAKKIIKSIPVKSFDIQVAGGASKFVVYNGSNNTITRYDLATLDKEDSSSCNPITTMAMGCDSEGPILIHGQVTQLSSIDLISLKQRTINARIPNKISNSEEFRLFGSANGRLFTGWRLNMNPALIYSFEFVENQCNVGYKHDSNGFAIPTSDGRFICTQVGRFESNLELVSDASIPTVIRVPAITGPNYISLATETGDSPFKSPLTKLSVHSNHDDSVLMTTRDFTFPDVFANRKRELLPLYQRILWLPQANTVVTAPSTADEIVLHHFNPLAELGQSKSDYLFVTSTAPRYVRRNEVISYQINSASNKKVEFDLISGPSGLTVSKAGVVNWTVPAEFSEQSVSATVRLRNAGGAELFHTFKLTWLPVSPQLAANPASTANRAPANTPPPTSPAMSQTQPPGVTQPAPAQTPVVSRRQGVTISFPSQIQQLVPAGSGSHLIAALPDSKEVAVIDIEAKKIVKRIPVDDRQILVAGGEEKFVICQRSNGTISRYDLDTQVRELTSSCDNYGCLALGCSSNGTMLATTVATGSGDILKLVELDLKTLKPLSHTINSSYPLFGNIMFLAAAKGNTYSAWRTSGSPSGMFCFEGSGDSWRSSYEHVSGGPVLPSPDGRFLYAGNGRNDSYCRKVSGGNSSGLNIPAATGNHYLNLETASPNVFNSKIQKMTIRSQNDDSKILSVDDIEFPELGQLGQREILPPYSRMHWLPASDALITVPLISDKLTIYDFVWKEELDKTGMDYLFVTSQPPGSFQKGKNYRYQIESISKDVQVSYKLDEGPPGMSVSKEGLVSWNVPANFPENSTIAMVNISSGSGKEINHTVRISNGSDSESPKSSRQQKPKSTPKKTAPTAPPIATQPKKEPKPEVAAQAEGPRETATISMAGPVERIVVGGSGRYLIGFVPSEKQVVVVDVVERKIRKRIPVDDTEVLLAAGETKFVVYLRGNAVLSRFDLQKLERELTIGCDQLTCLAMGSSSEGPLIAGKSTVEFLDLNTLKSNGMLTNENVPFPQGIQGVAASADGSTFLTSSGIQPCILRLENKGITKHQCPPAMFGAGGQLSPDGSILYTPNGRLTNEWQQLGKPNGMNQGRISIPAATGPFYLSLTVSGIAGQNQRGPSRLTLNCQNDDEPLLTINNVKLPTTPDNLHPAHVQGLGLDRRLFLAPKFNSLACVSDTKEQLFIHTFNPRKDLEASGIDYFFIASSPPRRFSPGEQWTYPMEVFSKHENVKFALDSGPPGMTVSTDGVVSWKTPANFSDHHFVALINVSNNAGQQLVHTIKSTDGTTSAAAGPPAAQVPNVVSNPKGPVNVAATPPQGLGKDAWRWKGPAPYFVRESGGGIGGVLLGTNLYRITSNGTLQTKPVTLKSNYVQLGIRSKSMVGVALQPTRVEILSETGDVIRKVMLQNHPATCLALHPHKPISYVSLDQQVENFRGIFVTVDEEAGTVKAGDEELGQEIQVDPTGRFLVSTYSQNIHVGDQLVVTQQPPARAPMQVPMQRRGRGVPLPRGGVPLPGRVGPGQVAPGQAVPRVGIRHEYANISLGLVYDLDEPEDATIYSAFPLGMPVGQLRVSHDGRRMISFPTTGKIQKALARNPLQKDEAPISFDLNAGRSGVIESSDLVFHPMLPIAVVANSSAIRFLNSEDGKPIVGKEVLEIPELSKLSVVRVMISSDAKSVIAVANENSGEYTLVSRPIPLTNDDRKAMEARAASPLKALKEGAPALAELTGWRNDELKQMSSAEITATYSDSVVIVKSGEKSGTGFFVSKSGLILTCAHCVSPLDEVQVIYHPVGKPDEKEMIEATIVRRDRKRDLCLLKVDAEIPFHSVLLADPVAAKSGDNVTVISNPGLGGEIMDNTVTTGVISNNRRKLEGSDFIQSSAAVNRGSSGGPMFDNQGRAIGVVALKAGIEGVGFAIPPDAIARFLLKATRQDGQHGELVRNWVKSDSTKLEGYRLLRVKDGSVKFANDRGKESTFSIGDFSPGDKALLEMIAADE